MSLWIAIAIGYLAGSCVTYTAVALLLSRDEHLNRRLHLDGPLPPSSGSQEAAS